MPASVLDGGVTPLGYVLAVPPRIKHNQLVIVVHGVSSQPATVIREFAPVGREYGFVTLAPDFSGMSFRGYQRLSSSAGAGGAALALERLAAQVSARLGLDPMRFDLAGFSGGAQFAHRFAMTRPGLVRRLVVAAAGWFSECDSSLAFPQGMGGMADDELLRQFLAIPIRIAVGTEDNSRGSNLRKESQLDARQGSNRLERAEFWHSHLIQRARELGIASDNRLVLLPGTGHQFRQAVENGNLDRMVANFLCGDGSLEQSNGLLSLDQTAPPSALVK